jgi:hypothetical protein
LQLAPRRAAVGRLEQAAVRAAPGGVLPGALAGFPEPGVDDHGIRGIEGDLRAARVLVDIKDSIEGLAAVERAVDAAFLVGAVGVAENGGEDAIGVAGVDDDLRDLLAVAKAEVGPGEAGVGRLVEAVADGKVGPLQALTRGDIDDAGVRRRDRDGADRAGRLVVEDGPPGPAVIVRLPDAAVADAHIEDVGLGGDSGHGPGAAGPVGADRAPAHLAEEARIDGLGLEAGRRNDGHGEKREACGRDERQHGGQGRSDATTRSGHGDPPGCKSALNGHG